MPFFSVIIPNYNHAPFLRQRIESVLNQTFTDFEIILLDDGSTDNSLEILNEYRSNNKVSQLILNKENTGSLTLQWKKGIELAQGNWIWIAESDDIASPYFLAEFSRMIDANPTAGLFYCDSLIVDRTPEKIIGKFTTRKNGLFSTHKWSSPYCRKGIEEINECLKYDSTINNMSSVILKKELAASILKEGYSFKYFADWYLYIRVCFKTDICYTPKTLNTYRVHPGSLLNAITSLIVSKKEYFEILRLLYHNEKVADRKKLVKHFAFNYLSFGFKEDGLIKGFHIIKSYFRSDPRLALLVVRELFFIKLIFTKYKNKFELKEGKVF